MNRILVVAAVAALAVPAAARAERLATSRADRQGAVASGVAAPAPTVPASPTAPVRVRDRGGVGLVEAPPSVTVMGKVHLALVPKVTDLQGSPIQQRAARPAGIRLGMHPILVDLQGETTLEEARPAVALAGTKLRGNLQLARLSTEIDTNEDAAPVTVAQGDGALR